MSIPPDSPARPYAAAYGEPVSEDERLEAEGLVFQIYNINCNPSLPGYPPLANVEFRSSDQDYDRLHHVFRWTHESRASYEQVFRNGFRAGNERNTREEIFYNLNFYINEAGRPLEAREASYAFISTTLSTSWRPPVNPQRTGIVYRFEIYAPGGILVAETLGNLYRPEFRGQEEVTFVNAIAPEYIRSVQRFRIEPTTASQRFPRLVRVDNDIIINGNFRPHPPMLIRIENPIYFRIDEDQDGRRRRVDLNRQVCYPSQHREKRQVSTDSNAVDWYASGVADIKSSTINAAFRSSRTNEAYIFVKEEYVLMNYAPGTTNDRVVNGPLLIRDGYPSLANTVFAEWGIDCAFGSHYGTKAFIFSGNLCAYIDYAPGTTDDKIIKGPMTITAMFPFFKGTVFKSGIDAAFESSTDGEAFLFRGNQYARINYNSPKLIGMRPISEGFYCLRGTGFESGIDAAFASHRSKEAYLFKGDSYALLEFAPDSNNDRIIGGIKKILPNWPSLQKFLPHDNRGPDINYNVTTTPTRPVHDEL